MSVSTGTGWAQLRQQARSLESQVRLSLLFSTSWVVLRMCTERLKAILLDRSFVPYLFAIFYKLQQDRKSVV